MVRGLMLCGAALAAGAALLPVPAAAQTPKMETCYVGQRVKTPGGRLGVVVAAEGAGCTVRRDGDPANVTDTWGAFMLQPVAGSPVRNAPTAAGLSLGEYACYGSGQRVLIGLGFKLLPGGRYTDLDSKSVGRYAVNGSTVVFTGGHLGGQTGRNVKANSFTLGAMASCELWG